MHCVEGHLAAEEISSVIRLVFQIELNVFKIIVRLFRVSARKFFGFHQGSRGLAFLFASQHERIRDAAAFALELHQPAMVHDSVHQRRCRLVVRQDRGHAYGRLIPRASASEVLAQDTLGPTATREKKAPSTPQLPRETQRLHDRCPLAALGALTVGGWHPYGKGIHLAS